MQIPFFLNQEKMEEGFCIPFKTQVCSVPPLSKFCKGKFPSKTSKIAEKNEDMVSCGRLKGCVIPTENRCAK